MTLARYFHTVRHLRPVQIFGRLWHRLNYVRPDLSAAPSLRHSAGQWAVSSKHPASMIDAETFQFLNQSGHVRTAADWNDPATEKLWLYNLHYFDDLNAVGAAKRSGWHHALIARWVAENPPGVGNGWEPYPTSLRIVNWVKWSLSGNGLDPAWLQSLAVQTRWLRGRLEWHLLGNHLLANAKALIFAGTFFAGPEADRWRYKGLEILRRELAEQVLADGGHFELSPMYHAIILGDLLDLIQLALRYPEVIETGTVMQWKRFAERMFHWLAAMIHPDGEIAFFNDAAFGIAPNLAALAANASDLGLDLAVPALPALTELADSGYVRMQSGSAVLIADVGKIGPDYLPGHAHADTLAFELSVFGYRLVVNSGTSRYGLGAERLRQRGTTAHSTVQVDGADSSEMWGGFRVARRARPFGLEIMTDGDGLELSGAHDGYQRLKGRPVHRRSWQLTDTSLKVTDRIEGGFRAAVARYHLHPAIKVAGNGKAGMLHLPDGRALRWAASGGVARVVRSTWHPEFGLSIPNQRLDLGFEGPCVTMTFDWD